MNKIISIITSITLSFALFSAITNSGFIFAQNLYSAPITADNKSLSQNQANQPSQTLPPQTQSGTIGQSGQSQSHSSQSQSQSGPVGQSGQASSGQSGQTPLEKQINQQNKLNQQNQTGKFPHDTNNTQNINRY